MLNCFLRSTLLLRNRATRIPLILLDNKLKEASAPSDKTRSLPSIDEIGSRFSSLTSGKGAATAEGEALRNIKRKGFGGVVDWCLFHQLHATELLPESELKTVNEAVMTWLLSFGKTFSCGQCLVLLGLVCDVFQHQQENAALHEPLLRCIASLVQSVEGSEALERQPVRLLVGAVHGLQRTEQSLPSSMVDQMPSFPGMYFALLNAYRSVEEENRSTEFQDQTDVLLTFLHILSHEALRDLVSESERIKVVQSVLDTVVPHLNDESKALPFSSLPLSHVRQLMEIVKVGASKDRIALLQYLLLRVNQPSEFTAQDQTQLPLIFDTVKGLPEEEWLLITNRVIEACKVTSTATALSLLPFVENRRTFLESGEFFSEERIKNMDPLDASFVLLIVEDCIGAEQIELLILQVLKNYPDLIQTLQHCRRHRSEDDDVEKNYPPDSSPAAEEISLVESGQYTLDQTLYNLLHFLLYSAKRKWLEERYEPTTLGILVNQLNWFEKETSSVELVDPSRAALEYQKTKMLVDLYRRGIAIQSFDPEIFYASRLKPLLERHTNEIADIPEVVRLLSTAVGMVDNPEQKRALLEKAVRLNSNQTQEAIALFLQCLAPQCIQLSVFPRSMLKALIKTRNFDVSALPLSNPEQTQTYHRLLQSHRVLCNALHYVMAVPEWKVAESQDDIRKAVYNWVNHFFTTIQQSRIQQGNDGSERTEETNAWKSLTDSDMEELFGSILQVGCRVSSGVFYEANFRYRYQKRGRMESENTTSDDADDKVSEVVPTSSLPGPGHFCVLVRGESSEEIPLNDDYFQRLLNESSLSLLPHVVTCFFTNSKGNQTESNLENDLRQATTLFTTLLRRGTDIGKEDHDLMSYAVFRSIQIVLEYISRHKEYNAIFKALHPATATATEIKSEEEMGKERVTPEDSMEEPTEAMEEEGLEYRFLEQYSSNIQEVDRLITQSIAFLGALHVKKLTLSHSVRLSFYFPTASNELFGKVEKQLKQFSVKELLLLTSHNPNTTQEVLSILQSMDIQKEVELTEFLSIGKHLPISISTVILQAHLPQVTFSWVTRILSAMSSRHAEMPFALLSQLLRFVVDHVDSATDSDRNLLLLILQKYMEAGKEKALEREEEEKEAEKPWRLTHSSSPSVTPPLSEEERQKRLTLLMECCDKVLRIDSICTLSDLTNFFRAYPSSLQNVTQQAIVKRAETQILNDILSTEPIDTPSLVQLVSLMASNDVLFYSLVKKIYKRFFTTQFSQAKSHTGNAVAVAECTQLAVFLSRSNNHKVKASAVSLKALTKVVNSLQTATDKVVALTELSDQCSGHHNSNHHSRSSVLYDGVINQLCQDVLVHDRHSLSASDFATYLRSVSKMKKWNVLLRDPESVRQFDEVFKEIFQKADPHSRCVILKATTTGENVLPRYENFVTTFVQEDIPLLSHEDIEMVLAMVLKMQNTEEVESLMDSIGTRLLPILRQCRRSTLIRILQCLGEFQMYDEELIRRVVSTLREQCEASQHTSGVILQSGQVFTLLHSMKRLNIDSDGLKVFAFTQLRRQLHHLSMPQVGEAVQLAIDLEMGYTPYLHDMIVKFLEYRDTDKSPRMAATVEEVCHVYGIEAPLNLVAAKLRKKLNKERTSQYWEAYNCLKMADEERLK